MMAEGRGSESVGKEEGESENKRGRPHYMLSTYTLYDS